MEYDADSSITSNVAKIQVIHLIRLCLLPTTTYLNLNEQDIQTGDSDPSSEEDVEMTDVSNDRMKGDLSAGMIPGCSQNTGKNKSHVR